MKIATTLLMFCVVAVTGVVAAEEETKPVQPDPAYCARRDADPEKCVIQDGPPPKPMVRKKKPAPK
jgi:hypothetical protein